MLKEIVQNLSENHKQKLQWLIGMHSERESKESMLSAYLENDDDDDDDDYYGCYTLNVSVTVLTGFLQGSLVMVDNLQETLTYTLYLIHFAVCALEYLILIMWFREWIIYAQWRCELQLIGHQSYVSLIYPMK